MERQTTIAMTELKSTKTSHAQLSMRQYRLNDKYISYPNSNLLFVYSMISGSVSSWPVSGTGD